MFHQFQMWQVFHQFQVWQVFHQFQVWQVFLFKPNTLAYVQIFFYSASPDPLQRGTI
jgi:hypothetical protein